MGLFTFTILFGIIMSAPLNAEKVLGTLKIGRMTKDKVETREDDQIPQYVQKLYHMFEHIPPGSRIRDLTIHALKPATVKMSPGNKIHYVFKCRHDLLSDHLNQVEVVLNKDVAKNTPYITLPLAVTICWNRVFCLHNLSLLQEEEFLIRDITASTKRFSSLPLPIGHPEISTISITITKGTHPSQLETYQPVIVFHSVPKGKYTPLIKPHSRRSWKKSSEHEESETSQKKRVKRATEETVEYTGPCKLQDWTIRFADMGWNGWIIMPEQYAANLCVGQCNSPDVINQVNLSSHAYLRNMYHESYHGVPPSLRDGNNNTIRVPQACCVPIRFVPVSTLFRNKDQTLTLKRIDEAIATKCGCL